MYINFQDNVNPTKEHNDSPLIGSLFIGFNVLCPTFNLSVSKGAETRRKSIGCRGFYRQI